MHAVSPTETSATEMIEEKRRRFMVTKHSCTLQPVEAGAVLLFSLFSVPSVSLRQGFSALSRSKRVADPSTTCENRIRSTPQSAMCFYYPSAGF